MSAEPQTADDEMVSVPAQTLDDLAACVTELLVGQAALMRQGASCEARARQGRLLSELGQRLARLRPTAAATMVLLVEANGHTFALPTDTVTEVVRVDAKLVAGSPAALQHGEVDFPIVHLADLWQLPDCGRAAGSFALLLSGERPVALLVDRVVGSRHIIATPLRGRLRNIRGARATAFHGAGDPVLLLDPHALLDAPVEHISA